MARKAKAKTAQRRRSRTTQPEPERQEPGLLREQTADHTVEEQGLAAGQQQLERKLEEARGGGSTLSGGDLDAAFEAGDSGEETAGGSSPTPDQDSVDQLGEAVGVVVEEAGKTRDLLEIFETQVPGIEQQTDLSAEGDELSEEEPPS